MRHRHKHRKHHKHRNHWEEVKKYMTDAQEKRMKELEDNANKTAEEQTLLNALLALDERAEEKEEADKALADAIAANPSPTPDPVTEAHDKVVAAQTALEAAQKAVDDAEAAVVPPTEEVPPVV